LPNFNKTRGLVALLLRLEVFLSVLVRGIPSVLGRTKVISSSDFFFF